MFSDIIQKREKKVLSRLRKVATTSKDSREKSKGFPYTTITHDN